MSLGRLSLENLLVLAGCVLCIFIYADSLTGPFVFDDEPNIVENRFIRIREARPGALYDAGFKSPIVNRPVANISFAVNYYFNGLNVVGFRLVNILIHILNGLVLFGLARATFRTPALKDNVRNAGAIAACAALIWMVHPLHTQSVAYIVQRMTSLATLFYLLSMLCYARARLTPAGRRKTMRFAGCGIAGLLALGSKEIAATLPAFIFLYEWYFFQNRRTDWLRRRLPALAAVFVFTLAIGLVYLGSMDPVAQVLAPYTEKGSSAGQRLLTQFRAVWFYIGLMFWPAPSRLNLDHDFPASVSLMEPAATLAAMLALAALLPAAVALARRHPLGSYSILWFLGNLVIESSVIALEAFFEHRTYLPSVMPAIALTALAFRLLRGKWPAVAVLSALALWWAGWTWQRSQVWGDAVALWQDCVKKSPAKARPYNNLGSAFSERDRLAEAAANFAKALEVKPDFEDARYNLGSVLIRMGRPEEGIVQLKEALRMDPKNFMAHNNIGLAYLLKEAYPEAIGHLREAVRLKPELESGHNNLGVALRHYGDVPGALRHYREAIRINPLYAEAYCNLGILLKETGKPVEAAENLRRALRINPGYAAARRELEEIEAKTGN